MSARDPRTIRIRCSTWDQVEAFYTEKLKGNVLVVKMPFRPGLGDPVTVALSLPDGLVFAIDGTVVKMGADDGGRVPVAVRLVGLTQEVRAQLRRLVAQARGQPVTPVSGMRAVSGTRPPSTPPAPPRSRSVPETVPPPVEPSFRDVAEDEREIFEELAATRERLHALPVHDVLGVPADADPEHARAAFLGLALKVHPDRFRRYRSTALRLLAAEVFLQLRRAMDRFDPSVAPPIGEEGWLMEMGDGSEPLPSADLDGVVGEPLQAAGSSPYSEMSVVRGATASASYEEEVTFTTSVRMRALTAEELFDEEPTPAQAPPGPAALAARAQVTTASFPVPAAVAPAAPERGLEATGRAALAEGRWREACEAFASALRVDAKNRQLRALYHVASGMDLRARGEGVKARLQFETALAHDRDCEEARRALLPEQPDKRGGLLKRFFDK